MFFRFHPEHELGGRVPRLGFYIILCTILIKTHNRVLLSTIFDSLYAYSNLAIFFYLQKSNRTIFCISLGCVKSMSEADVNFEF